MRTLQVVITSFFSDGLRNSLFNYMHGICFDFSLSEWFDFDTPKTRIPEDYIENSIDELTEKSTSIKCNSRLVGQRAFNFNFQTGR